MRARWLAVGLAVLTGASGVAFAAGPAQAAPRNVREAQWYLTPLKIAQAQQVTRGAGVVVAVVDTPVDGNHPDLTGQVLQGIGLNGSPGNGWGADKADVHGTEMASLIAGKGGDNNHLLGIAPAARILPVSTGLTANAQAEADAIRWAADHGAKVINVSQGHTGEAQPYEVEAVRYALSKDAVVVAASGNVGEGMAAVASPASIPGVVAVSGVIQSGDFWTGSARGPGNVLAAPATALPGAVPSVESASGYDVSDGTSGSAAIVSGVVALIRAKYPQLDAANVINRLIVTAKDNGNPGRDDNFGFGTIRPLDALTANVPAVAGNPLGGGASAGPLPSPTSTGGYQLSKGGRTVQPAVVIGVAAVILVLIVIVVVVVIVAVTRGRRRGTPAGPYQPNGPQQPQYPPPPQPFGYGPPPPSQTYAAPPPPSGYPPPPGQTQGSSWSPPGPPPPGPPPPSGPPVPPAANPGEGGHDQRYRI